MADNEFQWCIGHGYGRRTLQPLRHLCHRATCGHDRHDLLRHAQRGRVSLAGSQSLLTLTGGSGGTASYSGTLCNPGTLTSAAVLQGSGGTLGTTVISGSFSPAPPSNYYGTYGAGGGTLGTISGSFSGGTAFNVSAGSLSNGYIVPSGFGSTVTGNASAGFPSVSPNIVVYPNVYANSSGTGTVGRSTCRRRRTPNRATTTAFPPGSVGTYHGVPAEQELRNTMDLPDRRYDYRLQDFHRCHVRNTGTYPKPPGPNK